MNLSPFVVLPGAAGLVLAALLMVDARSARGRGTLGGTKASEIALAVLASINVAGMLGLGWIAIGLLIYDGFMAVEHAILGCLMAALILLTSGAFLLGRRGKPAAALAVSAVASLPTVAVYAFLFYLDNHPIDWR